MRSLIQLTINLESSANANGRQLVDQFLVTKKYLPTPIEISRGMYDRIMEIDEIQRNEQNLESIFQEIASAQASKPGDIAQANNAINDIKNAIRVLSSIPKEPNDERSNAVTNATFSISCQVKKPSSALVPGVVSIREGRVEVRFRHNNARTLEEATTQFVRDAWGQMGQTGLLEPFKDGETVAIREPFSTEDIYQGTICTPRNLRSRLRETVRSHLSEFVLFLLSVFFCAILFFLSRSILHQIEGPTDGISLPGLQWRQGWFDRLATAAFTTGVYSFVDLASYFFRVYNIPVIDWR